MKRKIFFMLMFAVVLCLSISLVVSAETAVSENNYDSNGDVVAISVGDYSFDGLTQNISYIDITYTTIDGSTNTGKMYFVTNLWGSKRQMHSTYIPADFDMSQMIYMPDKIDIDGNGSFSATEKILGTQGDKNLYCKYDSYSDGIFSNTVNVKYEMVKLSYSTYLEYFGPSAYCWVPLTTLTHSGREAVEGTFFVASSVSKFYGGNNGSSFGGTANGGINGKTGKFTRLVFEERDHYVEFGQYALCRNVIEEVVFLGTGTYGIGSDSIAYLWKEGTNQPCLKRVVIQSGVNLSGSLALNVGNYDIVFIGENEEYSSDIYGGVLKNATGNVIYEKICYVYGHAEGENDNDCTTYLGCLNCDAVLEEAYETHEINKTFEYENGYLSAGIRREGCTRCAYGVEESTPALFTCLGYSFAEKSNGGIVVGFTVNYGAISNYTSETEKTLSFGVFASLKDSIANKDIFDENGKTTSGVISADVTINGMAAFDLKISGINETQRDVKLVLGAYVKVTKGEMVEYFYLQASEPLENEKYAYITYNELVK